MVLIYHVGLGFIADATKIYGLLIRWQTIFNSSLCGIWWFCHFLFKLRPFKVKSAFNCINKQGVMFHGVCELEYMSKMILFYYWLMCVNNVHLCRVCVLWLAIDFSSLFSSQIGQYSHFTLRGKFNLYEYNKVLSVSSACTLYISNLSLYTKTAHLFLNQIVCFSHYQNTVVYLIIVSFSSLFSLITLSNSPSTTTRTRQLIDDVICRTKRKHVCVWTTCIEITCIWRDDYVELRVKFLSCLGFDIFQIYFYLNIFVYIWK